MLGIEKIEKKKKEPNVYTIYLTDGQAYDIWDELMVKYKFSVERPVSEVLLEEARVETQYHRGKDSALKYLRNKNRSLTEIELYLKNKAYNMDIIYKVKDFLVENNLINDEAFAEAYIQEAVHKGCGSLKIKYDLEMKGISEAVIEEKIHQYLPKEQEHEMANLIFQSKLKGQAPNKKNCAKAARYLASKGYDPEMINEIVYKLI
ncbi:MAG: recombination regulator RecX [Clostridia bacterium]|nr:recombination regulator RecX [Clostridia bacterium]